MLKSLKNTTILGDTTGGATGNPKKYTVKENWEYYISTWQATDLNDNQIEDRGIYPDITVSVHDSLSSGKRDIILENAIERLK